MKMQFGERRRGWGLGLALTLASALTSACFRDEGPAQLCEGAACGLTTITTADNSSSGGDATSVAPTTSTGEPATGTSEDSTTGPPLDPSVTFRIDSLTFIDPHLFFTSSDDPPVCNDVTGFVNLSLDDDAKTGQFNLLARFEDFNGVNEMRLIDGDCEDPAMPGGRRLCWPNPNAQVVLLASQRLAAGACRQLDPTVYQPKTLPDIHDPQAPCVRSNRVDFSIPVNDAVGVLSLRQAQFSGRIDDVDAPARLEDGLLSGFLSQKAAESLIIENDLLGQVSIWSLIDAPACVDTFPEYLPSLDEAELDNDLLIGVWLAINFSAERVDFVAAP